MPVYAVKFRSKRHKYCMQFLLEVFIEFFIRDTYICKRTSCHFHGICISRAEIPCEDFLYFLPRILPPVSLNNRIIHT